MNTQTSPSAIGLVGFDGDDTLWKSEDYYQKAEHEFGLILSNTSTCTTPVPPSICSRCSGVTWPCSATVPRA